MPDTESWPALSYAEWKDTHHALHMWMQMVGKVQLALAPRTNHWWSAAQHVTARGLTTTPLPYSGGLVEICFDFIDHVLRLETSGGDHREIPLVPQSVARFYERFLAALHELGVEARIWPMPVEVPNPVRFTLDTTGTYDPEAAHRAWRILFQTDAILKEFRAGFIGKCSPVHFFWGSFDLAVTRFSGRKAPPRPEADAMTREAYSHEVSSAGWWPGNDAAPAPMFYAYAAPEPPGFDRARIRPAEAFYSAEMKEYFYRYDDMRRAADPRASLLEFLTTTYTAAADLAHWERAALERTASA